MNPKAEAGSSPVVGAQSCCALGSTPPARAQQDCAPTKNTGYSLWLWVGAGFLFVAILWTAMFTAARQADTRTVPLATQGGRS
jgi:hypothetical protein